MHGSRSKETAADNGSNVDEAREAIKAALLLSSLKYTTLHPTTAKELQHLETEYLARAYNTCRRETDDANEEDQTLEEIVEREIKSYRPPVTPPVPALDGMVGRCSKPFQKQLTGSDVRDDQSRLSINKADVEACLFPLFDDDDVAVRRSLEKGIPATLYDGDGKTYSVTFKCWVGKIHVLTGTGWKQLFKKHQLKKREHFVTVWMFFHAATGGLCFAITWRRVLGVAEHYKKKRLHAPGAGCS